MTYMSKPGSTNEGASPEPRRDYMSTWTPCDICETPKECEARGCQKMAHDVYARPDPPAPVALTDEQIIERVGRDAVAWLPVSEDEEVVGFVRWILETFAPAALYAGAPPSGAEPPALTDSFWLIERGPNQGQLPHVWWLKTPDAMRYRWVEDATKATRFKTFSEAEATAQSEYVPNYVVTSHSIIDRAALASAPSGDHDTKNFFSEESALRLAQANYERGIEEGTRLAKQELKE